MRSDISTLLQQAKDGSDEAREQLFAKLHGELRAHARTLMRDERANHTLQASALVNEACLRIMREGRLESSENKRQLFHAAIRAMRQVLIDHARARSTRKRGGEFTRKPMDVVLEHFESTHGLSFLDLEVALERLQAEYPDEFETLNLRFFAGLTIVETADLLSCSKSRVDANWRFARAKLLSWLQDA